jgi:hypothetical protein
VPVAVPTVRCPAATPCGRRERSFAPSDLRLRTRVALPC